MRELVCIALQLFTLLVFLRIILSWFPPTSGGMFATFQRIVFEATEWVMGPLRRVIPPARIGSVALDLSPLVVLIAISILQGVICVR